MKEGAAIETRLWVRRRMAVSRSRRGLRSEPRTSGQQIRKSQGMLLRLRCGLSVKRMNMLRPWSFEICATETASALALGAAPSLVCLVADLPRLPDSVVRKQVIRQRGGHG